jgi:uncharacterized membrane protein
MSVIKFNTEQAVSKIKNYSWSIIAIVFIVLYYKYSWGSFNNGILKIDHQSEFLYDFVHHYYPMGKTIFGFEQIAPGYYYTSFFAILIAPVCDFDLKSAIIIWSIVQIIFVLLLFLVAKLLIKPTYIYSVLYLLLLIISYPILNNLKWGQVSVLLTILILLSFLSARRGSNIIAGILLALAVAIKYYPIIFIIYFVFNRKYKVCISFALTFILFYFLLPVAFLGFSDWFKFESASIQALSNNEGLRQDINSQYFLHVVLRWAESFGINTIINLNIMIIQLLGYLIAGLCFVMMWIFQSNKEADRYCLSMVSIFLAIPFLVQSSWPHYFVYLPFCQLAIFYYLVNKLKELKKIGAIASLFTFLSMLCSSVFVFDIFGHWSLFNKNGILFLSNFLLLISLLLIIIKNNKKFIRANWMVLKKADSSTKCNTV